MKNSLNTKPLSRTNVVVKKIIDSIINGDFSDGELLPPENTLCEIFGVSRSILREAIKIVSSKGLIEVRQGYGTMICLPKANVPEEALSIYLQAHSISLLQPMEIRAPIEIEATKLAAERREEEHLAAMEEALQRMQAPSITLKTWVNADDDLHKVIVEATENPIFGIILRPIMGYLHLSRLVSIRHFGLSIGIEEHKTIVDAIRAQDAVTAAERMEAHMDATFFRLKEVSSLLE